MRRIVDDIRAVCGCCVAFALLVTLLLASLFIRIEADKPWCEE